MKLNTLFKRWSGTIAISHYLAVSVLLLALAVVGLTIKLITVHERIALIPPNLNERAEVNWKSASANYMEAWGIFIAGSIGSITPQTATTVADAMGYYFDAAIYPAVRTQVLSIVNDPNYTHSGTINVFTPKVTQWEASTEKVFVQGILATTAYKNTSQPIAQIPVTYEMVLKIHAGVPKVMKFDSYVGAPRTLKWREAHRAELEAEEAKAAKVGSIIPQDSEIRNAIEDLARKAAENHVPTTPEGTDPKTSTSQPPAAAKPSASSNLPTPKEQL